MIVCFSLMPECSTIASLLVVAVSQAPLVLENPSAKLEINRCGPYALQVCADYLTPPVVRQDIEEYLPNDGRVTTFSQLADAAGQLGFRTVAIRWASLPRDLRDSPAILPVVRQGHPHFIAALGHQNDRWLIVDFPESRWVSDRHLKENLAWTGEALHIAKDRWGIANLYLLIHAPKIVLLICFSLFALFFCTWLRHRRSSSTNDRNSNSSQLAVTSSLIFLCIPGILGCVEQASQVLPPKLVRLEPAEVTVEGTSLADVNKESEVELTLTNVSSSPFQIQRIMASCGCTEVGTPSAKEVAPNQDAVIPIRVQLPKAGTKTANLAIVLDTQSGEQTIPWRIKMIGPPRSFEVPSIVSMPNAITLRENCDGDSESDFEVVTLESSDSIPWISNIVSDMPHIEIEQLGFAETIGDEPQTYRRFYSYRVGSSRAANSDSLKRPSVTTGDIHLLNSHLSESIGTATIRVRKWEPVRLIPKAVYFRFSDDSEAVIERTIRVQVSDAQFSPPRVEVESGVSWLDISSVSIDDVDGRDEAQVSITVLRSALPNEATIRATIRVTCVGEGGNTIGVNLPVLIRKRT